MRYTDLPTPDHCSALICLPKFFVRQTLLRLTFLPQAFLSEAARRVMHNCLAIALCFALLGNAAAAQELDSSTLQQEDAAQLEASQDQQPLPAQNSSQTNQPSVNPPPIQLPGNQPPSAAQTGGMFTVPAGTKLPLGLLRPISVQSSDPVADLYLQI